MGSIADSPVVFRCADMTGAEEGKGRKVQGSSGKVREGQGREGLVE